MTEVNAACQRTIDEQNALADKLCKLRNEVSRAHPDNLRRGDLMQMRAMFIATLAESERVARSNAEMVSVALRLLETLRPSG